MSMVINPFWGTPSGGPDPYWDNVVLLMGADGADGSTALIDESPLAQTVTVFGAAQIDTTIKKFGTGSLFCEARGTDYVQVPDNAGFAFGNGDFTMEVWWMPQDIVSHAIMGQGSAGGFAWNGIAVEANSLRFFQRDFAEVYEDTNPDFPVGETWYLLCAERAGAIMRLYRDGVMVRKVTVGTTALTNATDPYRVGSIWPSSGVDAHIDEVRVTKGVARYNSDAGYTPLNMKYPRFGP